MARGVADLIAYEDKLTVIYYSTQRPERVADFIPHEEKINKCNILFNIVFRGGGGFDPL